MTEQLTFTIQCGENTCEFEDGMCEYRINKVVRYCNLFRQSLRSRTPDETLRCKQCKEASNEGH
jgi:hypothetical protein